MPSFQCFNYLMVWTPIEWSPRNEWGLRLMMAAALAADSVEEAISLGLIRSRSPDWLNRVREAFSSLEGAPCPDTDAKDLATMRKWLEFGAGQPILAAYRKEAEARRTKRSGRNLSESANRAQRN